MAGMSDQKWEVGDRVRVSAGYWHVEIRGAVGVITEPPENARTEMPDGCFWIEFVEAIPVSDRTQLIEACAIDVDGLERIAPDAEPPGRNH
jgi:hypothetical protein